MTCPWHGFQYDVTNGRSPAPFTEMVPTFNLRLNGAQTVTGVIELTPYPILRVTEGNALIAAGKTLMLSGQGKRGSDARVMEAGSQLRSITGIILQRGTIDMLQVDGRARGVVEVEGEAPVLETVRWQMSIWRDTALAVSLFRAGRGIVQHSCEEDDP